MTSDQKGAAVAITMVVTVASLLIGFPVYNYTHGEADNQCYRQLTPLATYSEARPMLDSFMEDRFLTLRECTLMKDKYREIRRRRDNIAEVVRYENSVR